MFGPLEVRAGSGELLGAGGARLRTLRAISIVSPHGLHRGFTSGVSDSPAFVALCPRCRFSLLRSLEMIVSRMAELARLDALLAGLVRGEAGALVVHGEAGIGKTTLLDALVERCGGAVTVVRACGAETEAELAFSALTDLFYPMLRQLDALPAP